MALGAAHIPHSPPDTYIDGEKIAHQYPTAHMDMILEMDKAVGSILQALEDRNLADNTLIIFLSDNGGLGGIYGSEKFDHHSNAALRGSKGSIYEGGHRIPLIMRYDGVIPAGEKRLKLMGINDIFATVCDVAGVNIPKGRSAIDSVSYFDYIKSKKGKGLRENLGIWRYNGKELRMRAIITVKNEKVVHILPNITYPDGIIEYYDLKNDPGETTDLSTKNRYEKKIQKLLRKLDKLTSDSSGGK